MSTTGEKQRLLLAEDQPKAPVPQVPIEALTSNKLALAFPVASLLASRFTERSTLVGEDDDDARFVL